MIERRDFLLGAAMAAMLPSFRAVAQTAGAASPAGDAPSKSAPSKLDAVFDKFVQERLQRSPELATSLGLDHGALAPLKSRLQDVSLAALQKDRADNTRHIAELKAVDRSTLNGIDAANYDTVMFILQVREEGDRLFEYGAGGSGAPYVLSQLTGSYHEVPDFLDTQHRIEVAADAEAYLARMQAFVTILGQELEVLNHDVALGVVPPDFIIDKTLVQMQAFLDTPADQAILVKSLGRRCAEKTITGDYATRAASLYRDGILPALQKQADRLKALRATAAHDAGAERLPKAQIITGFR